MVKNLPANAGDTGDEGWMPESGRYPGGGSATHSSILAWKILWTEKPGGLQSMGLQRVGNDSACRHAQMHVRDRGINQVRRREYHWDRRNRMGKVLIQKGRQNFLGCPA